MLKLSACPKKSAKKRSRSNPPKSCFLHVFVFFLPVDLGPSPVPSSLPAVPVAFDPTQPAVAAAEAARPVTPVAIDQGFSMIFEGCCPMILISIYYVNDPSLDKG
jgi:hypothetical protein